MPSAGGHVPTQTLAPRLGEGLGDGEPEARLVGDARDEGALAREIDGEHRAHNRRIPGASHASGGPPRGGDRLRVQVSRSVIGPFTDKPGDAREEPVHARTAPVEAVAAEAPRAKVAAVGRGDRVRCERARGRRAPSPARSADRRRGTARRPLRPRAEKRARGVDDSALGATSDAPTRASRPALLVSETTAPAAGATGPRGCAGWRPAPCKARRRARGPRRPRARGTLHSARGGRRRRPDVACPGAARPSAQLFELGFDTSSAKTRPLPPRRPRARASFLRRPRTRRRRGARRRRDSSATSCEASSCTSKSPRAKAAVRKRRSPPVEDHPERARARSARGDPAVGEGRMHASRVVRSVLTRATRGASRSCARGPPRATPRRRRRGSRRPASPAARRRTPRRSVGRLDAIEPPLQRRPLGRTGSAIASRRRGAPARPCAPAVANARRRSYRTSAWTSCTAVARSSSLTGRSARSSRSLRNGHARARASSTAATTTARTRATSPARAPRGRAGVRRRRSTRASTPSPPNRVTC